tara:strand:- start:12852 stop:13229 length:378 start_codon:yes stop_codon:yes gene_type:complete
MKIVQNFLRFLVVGAFASIINLLCFYILFYQLNIHETLSYSISYVLGVVIGYLLNKKWSFNYKNKDNKNLFTKYFLVYTFNLFLGMGFFELIFILYNIEEIAIQFIIIIITAISNFLGLKIFVFR